MSLREQQRRAWRAEMDKVSRDWQRVRPLTPQYHRRRTGRGSELRETTLRDDMERLVQYVMGRWPRLPKDREDVADAAIRAQRAPKPWRKKA
jgi:hypothetical protein